MIDFCQGTLPSLCVFQGAVHVGVQESQCLLAQKLRMSVAGKQALKEPN